MAATLRNYVSVKAPSGKSPLVKAMRPLLVSQNRLGGAVTYFGSIVMDLREVMMVHADAATAFAEEEHKQLDDEHQHRSDIIKPLTSYTQIGKKKDKKSEDAQEVDEGDGEETKKDGEDLAKDEKKEYGWLETIFKGFAPIVDFLAKAVTAFVTYKAFDLLSNPNNIKAAETVLKVIGGIVGFAAKLGGFGLFTVMDGVTRVFGVNPDSKGIGKVFDKMFGVLQIFGGLASLWAATRVLMPWKLVGDYKKMKKLGDILKKIKNFFQRKPNVPKVTRGKGGKIKGKPKAKVTGSKVSVKDQLKQFGKKKLAQAKNLKAKGSSVVKKSISKAKGVIKGVRNMGTSMSNMRKGIGEFGKNMMGKGKGLLGKGRSLLGRGKQFASDAISKGKNLYKGASEFATKNFGRFKNIAKKAGKGVFDWGKQQGSKIAKLKDMVKNPQQMFKPVMERIKSTIKPIIEKNPNIKKVLSLKNAKTGLKNAKNFALKNVKLAMKSKEMANLSKFLKEAKGRVKIGGIDKVIAAVMGLIDYGMGESPINAIVSATSGLLGYAAGFAIGSPFGGFPGFITGAAGGMAGEFIGSQLLRGLGKMPGFKKLTEIEDPLANALGLTPRPILRDPEVEKRKENREEYERYKEESGFNDRVNDIKTNPLDKKVYSLGGDDTEKLSLREVNTLAEGGDERAKKLLVALKNMSDSQGPGSVTWSKKTTMTNEKGDTITSSDSYDSRAEGGLVSPEQDTSSQIKGKPSVWNNLYTEMTNNIKNKEEKAQPMTSMVQPIIDPRVTPKQLTTSPSSSINNKVSTLTDTSKAKVQRSKQSTTNTRLMVMRQQIIRSVPTPTPEVIDLTKSPSPLLT